MTLDKAIELLDFDIRDSGYVNPVELNEAEHLGIEALKRLQWGRKVDYAFAWGRLPGETEG